MTTPNPHGASDASGALCWVKASASETSDCVEIAVAWGAAWIRDSKDPHGPHLTVTGTVFAAFLNTLKGRRP